VAEGFSIRIVDVSGRPLDDLVADQQFYVELHVPDGWADPGDTVVVEFATSEGTADLEITWTDTIDGEWKFTSTPITVTGGAEGGGEVGALGFSWSTGNLDPGEIEYEDGSPLTVRWKSAGDRVAEDTVTLYESPISMGLAQTAAYIAKADAVYRNTLINVAAARDEIAQYPDSEEKAEVEAALDSLEAEARSRMRFIKGARDGLYNDAWAPHARLAVARGYLGYLEYPPELLGAVGWGTVLDLERANKEASDEEVRRIVWNGLGQALIGGYRLFAHATLVAQVRTLFFGVDELGQEVGWDGQVLALLDLITEAAFTGANLKFQFDHLAVPTRPRLRSGTSSGLDAPRFQGTRLSEANTGDILLPEQVGMMRQATVEAQRVARVPREGYPDGVLVWTRPSNVAGLEWRQAGHPPKGMEIKAKTINDLDVLLGAEPGSQGLVGFFEPVLPSSAGFDPRFFAKLQSRFDQRMGEINGSTGVDMRALEANGQVRFDNGVVVDTGLYGNTGKGITGDYDLFEITDLGGQPVSEAVYHQVVDELMHAPSFQALHGAHLRWKDLPDFYKPAKVQANTEIFDKIVSGHRQGGEEPLIVFGGDRPAFAVWSDQLPTRHLSDLPENVATTFRHSLSPDGTLIRGISPLFLDEDAGEGWEDEWNAVVEQALVVLSRSTLDDEDGRGSDPAPGDDPVLDAAWDEFLLQADAAAANPSVLHYLDESPFTPVAPVARPAAPEEEPESEEVDPAWAALVAQAESRIHDSNLDHESGLDDYDPDRPTPEPASAGDGDGPAAVPPRESVLNYLHGEPDLGLTPVPPERSALDYLDETPGVPAAIRRVPAWGWVAGVALPVLLGAYLVLGGGDDTDPVSSTPVPVATATTAATATTPEPSATVLPPAATVPAGATMTQTGIPTLIVCPDGSTFSGFEQPDGSYLDAQSGEVRVCPPPPR
jgi:hypothetical protein